MTRKLSRGVALHRTRSRHTCMSIVDHLRRKQEAEVTWTRTPYKCRTRLGGRGQPHLHHLVLTPHSTPQGFPPTFPIPLVSSHKLSLKHQMPESVLPTKQFLVRSHSSSLPNDKAPDYRNHRHIIHGQRVGGVV
jgi:hypothetical protein